MYKTRKFRSRKGRSLKNRKHRGGRRCKSKRRRHRGPKSRSKGRGPSSEVYNKKEINRLKSQAKKGWEARDRAEGKAMAQADKVADAVRKKEFKRVLAAEYGKILKSVFDYTDREVNGKSPEHLEGELDYRLAEVDEVIHGMMNI
jgi:hypothetical protein